MKTAVIYARYSSNNQTEQSIEGQLRVCKQYAESQGILILDTYKIVNKKVVIDEEQAEIIRYIFNQYLLDVQVKEIIATLREKGILNRGKPFARNTVYRLLENEKYAGVYRHGDEVFENTYPPIITKEIFARVSEKTKTNKYGKRSVAVKYLLRDKLKCGYC